MDLSTQRQLALASQLAYEGPKDIEKASALAGFESAVQHSVRNHSVSLLQLHNTTIIAFRGTCSRADWRSNLLLVPTPRPWGWVHMGFAKAAEALWNPVREAIQHSVLSGRSIYFTGHSLGGAMAVVSALHAHYELHCSIAGLATFGQPPLVGWAGARSLCAAGLCQYPRIVSSVDVVVTGPFLPFFHAGSIRYFDANGMLHTQMSWLRFFQDAIRHGWRLQVAAQVQQHFMDHYIELLTGQLARQRSGTHGIVEAQDGEHCVAPNRSRPL